MRADSAANVAAVKVSDQQSGDHVDTSRAAIQRSLTMLSAGFDRVLEID